MVVRIPHTLVAWFPLILFCGEVILVLTVGPMLIANARRRRNLPAIPLISRVSRCFVGSVLAILAWTAVFFFLQALSIPQVSIFDHLAVQIIVVCLLLAVISIIAFLIAARICAGPIKEPKPTPRRRKYFIAPGLLILVCIWAFWAVFIPYLGNMLVIPRTACLSPIRNALLQYESEKGKYPDRLGQLVEAEYIFPRQFRIYGANRTVESSEKVYGKPYYPPKEFHYIPLPADAPKNLVWVWIDPTLYDGEPVPVLYKNGDVLRVKPEVLCLELIKTYAWLLDPSQETGAKQDHAIEPSSEQTDYLSFRFSHPGVEMYLANLFTVEVILVLIAGPILISRIRRKYKLSDIGFVRSIGTCFAASLLSIVVWMVFMGIFSSILSSMSKMNGIITWIIPILFLTVASTSILFFASRLCASPVKVSNTNKEKRFFFAPGMLILVCIWAFWIVFFPFWGQIQSRLNTVVERTHLVGAGTALELYALKEGEYPEHLGLLVDKGYCSAKYFQLLGTKKERDVPKYVEGKPYRVSSDYLYIPLSEYAPGNLIFLCPSPALYDGNSLPVLYKAGHVATTSPEEVVKEIGQTYEWLLEHRGKETPSTAPVGATSKKTPR